MKLNDLTGKKFGRLLVICRSYIRKNNKVYWECKCDCGTIKHISGGSLISKNSISCGCAKKERIIKQNIANKKPINEFELCKDCNVHLTYKNWWSSWRKTNNNICIDCGRKRHKNWDTKEKQKNRALKNAFNLSLEEYNKILQEQDYKCAICGSITPKGKGSFHVDHCHASGMIRGLLCHYCNVGLGNFRDNIELLDKAKKYLKSKGLHYAR